MVQYDQTRFDASFAALADSTRRGVLEQLGQGDASISVLANKFHITLKGMSLVSCEMDVRVGGGYWLEFGHSASDQTMAFFGSYVEAVPHSRLVWTNEESDEGAVTTVTFEEKGGKTQLVMCELYPSKEALERNGGTEGGASEHFRQLDALLVTLVGIAG